MIRLCVITFSLFLGLTQTVLAVSINEVAWMGSGANSNHEWIELYNATEATVSLAGWSLTDGANLNIQLSGDIGSVSYAVLERTSDDSAPGTALLTYSGALVNTGATLTLRDGSGGVVDQVTGGTDWQNIGGDNATKETAQYTATGWVTDIPTPGELNRSGRIVVPDEAVSTSSATTTATTTTNLNTNTNKTSNRSGSSRGSAATVRIKNPETKMVLTPDVQSVAYVNQDIILSVEASGAYQNQDSMVRYVWNFGDMHTTIGKRVTHSYSYPGEYVITVYAKNGKTEQVARHEITVLPVVFSLTKSTEGNILVHNNALYDTDISGYVVKGDELVVFPPRTIILPRATITIPRDLVGSPSSVALYDAKNNLITSTYENLISTEEVSLRASHSPVVAWKDEAVVTPLSFGFLTAEAAPIENTLPREVINISASDSADDASSASGNSRQTYLWLIGVLGLAFLLMLLKSDSSNVTKA